MTSFRGRYLFFSGYKSISGAPKPRPEIWISGQPGKDWGPTDHCALQQASHLGPKTIHIFDWRRRSCPSLAPPLPLTPTRAYRAPPFTACRDVTATAIFARERISFARKTQLHRSPTRAVRNSKRRWTTPTTSSLADSSPTSPSPAPCLHMAFTHRTSLSQYFQF
jgi:hypothetical protein